MRMQTISTSGMLFHTGKGIDPSAISPMSVIRGPHPEVYPDSAPALKVADPEHGDSASKSDHLAGDRSPHQDRSWLRLVGGRPVTGIGRSGVGP